MKKKKKGFIEVATGFAAFFIVSVLVLTTFTIRRLDATKIQVEDSLVTSNLAAAIIDVNEYGTTNNIIIADYKKAYNQFCDALKNNLNLDDGFKPRNNNFFKSKIDVVEFVIYNVKGNSIEEVKIGDKNIQKKMYENNVGKLTTPDGAVISSTTIYSKIGFTIGGLSDDLYYKTKEISVDIVSNI